MPAGGGVATRLTFLGSEACAVSGWTPDGGAILFCTDANAPFAKETHAYRVAATGGVPEPLALGHARSLAMHADGRIVLGRNNDDPARWKRYRGGTAGDIWIDRSGNATFERLISLPGNPVWPMWVGERVAFLSDHEGVGNIYSVFPDGSDLRRHTNEIEYFVRFPATDGTTIVFTAGAAIYTLDPSDDRVARVDVDTPSSAPQTARRFIEIGEHLEHFAPSPDGTALALVSRGAAFTMPLWEEAVASHGAGSRVRYRATRTAPNTSKCAMPRATRRRGRSPSAKTSAASSNSRPRPQATSSPSRITATNCSSSISRANGCARSTRARHRTSPTSRFRPTAAGSRTRVPCSPIPLRAPTPTPRSCGSLKSNPARFTT
jgi:tricorn protease-like protein